MKKVFKLLLIPVLALAISSTAKAATKNVGSFAELKSAINGAANGDVIKLTADIISNSSDVLNITKSITIDGQNKTLSHNGAYSIFRINRNVASPEFVTVTISNLKMIQPEGDNYGIASNSSLEQLTLENCDISCATGGNPHGIIIGGPAPIGGSKLIIRNSHIDATSSGYPIRVFSPVVITMEDTQTEGYCGVYFARGANGYSGSAGPRGSTLSASKCQFDAPNVHNGASNAFGVFPLEDDGISISLENCGINSTQHGDQSQSLLVLSEWTPKDRRTNAVSLSITGDNSYINGNMLDNAWASGYFNNGSKEDYSAPIPSPYPLSITISGGTYAFNPTLQSWYKNAQLEGEELTNPSNIGTITIPSGYEVAEIHTTQSGSAATLYRVRKTITSSTALNDNSGNNETKEVKVESNVTLANAETTAKYVEVKGGTGSEPVITVTVPAAKTLEVVTGMDVTGNAQVVAQPGSTVVVGEGGVIAENASNIVIEADETGAASFLLSPEVIVNTTPVVTVKMTTKVGIDAFGDNTWHRFACPVANLSSMKRSIPTETWIYGWDYSAPGGGDWKSITSLAEIQPFYGYTLTNDAADGTTVVYSFTGELAGNTDNTLHFNSRGYNYFGNSYSGYIDIRQLLQMFDLGSIDASVWMWNKDIQAFKGVGIHDLQTKAYGSMEAWQEEVAPMQTFILRWMNGSDAPDGDVSYESAIWGNPRYSAITGVPAPSFAPARAPKTADNAAFRVRITSANGKADYIDFRESNSFSDAYESGYDVAKFMNDRTLNIYSVQGEENCETVVTNNLLGKTVSMKTLNEANYTLSFANISGEVYAIKDNQTGTVTTIAEGNTYEFTAQPNATTEGRFEIVAVSEVTTSVENASVAPAAQGIYTLLGQYIGESTMWNSLPAGVYIVNGVKLVK